MANMAAVRAYDKDVLCKTFFDKDVGNFSTSLSYFWFDALV